MNLTTTGKVTTPISFSAFLCRFFYCTFYFLWIFWYNRITWKYSPVLLLDVSLLLENYTFLLEFLIFTKLLFHSFTAADGHSSCAWRNMHCIRDI